MNWCLIISEQYIRGIEQVNADRYIMKKKFSLRRMSAELNKEIERI